LFSPPRVYFDTANLAQITDENALGDLWPLFHRLVTTGYIVPLFSYPQVTERVPTSPNTLARMDATITPLIAGGYGSWVRDYNTLQRIEIENELHRQGWGRRNAQSPVVPSATDLVVDSNRQEVVDRFPGFRFIADLETKRRRPSFRSLGPSFVDFQKKQRAQRGRRSLTDDEIMEAIAPYLPNEYSSRFPEGFTLDRSRMPFIDLMFGYFSGSLLSDGGDENSDLMDVLHLCGIAYSSHGFVDKKTFDRLRRGGVLRTGIHRNVDLRAVLDDFVRDSSRD